MTRTLVATPDPQRPRNEPIAWTNGTGTTAAGGNVRVDWSRLDIQRVH